MTIGERMLALKAQIDKRKKAHRGYGDLLHEMRLLVVKQLKREIRQDKRSAA